MKLKKEFITHNTEEGTVIVDTSTKNRFNGIVNSNETASFIVEGLKKETTIEQLKDHLLEEYNVDEETALKAVEYVVSKLRSINAIEE